MRSLGGRKKINNKGIYVSKSSIITFYLFGVYYNNLLFCPTFTTSGSKKKTQLKRIEREKNKVSFSDLTITDAISRKRKNDEKFCENVDEVFFFRKNFVPITIRSFSVYFHFTIFIFISSLFCLFGFCLLICIITSKKSYFVADASFLGREKNSKYYSFFEETTPFSKTFTILL